MSKPTGWYRLPSGALYHGTQPPRGVPVAEPADTGELVPPPQDARKDVLIAFVDEHDLDGDGRSATPNRTKAELWKLIEEAVQARQGGPQVGADVLVQEGDTDPLEVGAGDGAGDEAVDVPIGHDPEG